MTLGRPHLHLRTVGSTNARARELASAGAPHGTLVSAEAQTAGRGRLGRSWVTPPGQALALSLLLREHDDLLSLRAGLAVADLAGAGALVKWPNDVWVEGRKVAGVLVEGVPAEGWVVLGIGVNVGADVAELPPGAGTLAAPEAEAPLAVALERLLAALEHRLAEPPGTTVAALRGRDALLGRRVRWSDGRGQGAGIDDRGRLRVRTAGGDEHALESGEVVLDG